MSTDDPTTRVTLLQKLCGGANSEAWRTFLTRYQPLIYGRCRAAGLQHHDAEDLTSVVLMKLLKVLPLFTYDPTKKFRAWLATIVRHAAQDFWDSQRRRPEAAGSGDPAMLALLREHPDPTLVDALTTELNQLVGADLEIAYTIQERVRRRVAPQTWEAFRQTELEGRLPAEVAEELGISLATLYVYRNRIKKNLKQEAERVRLLCDTPPEAAP